MATENSYLAGSTQGEDERLFEQIERYGDKDRISVTSNSTVYDFAGMLRH